MSDVRAQTREDAARAAFDAFYADGTPYNEIEQAMFGQVVDAILVALDRSGIRLVGVNDVVLTWDELLSIERVFTFADHTDADYRFGLDAIQREVAAHYAAHPDGGSDGDDLVGADPEMPPVVASDVVPPDEVWIVQDDQIVGKITNIAAHPDGGSGDE